MPNEKLTITLTGRPPVKIAKDEWPIVASGDSWSGGGCEAQANRTYKIKVRQHADGRAIVYGVFNSQWQNEDDRRGGELLAAGEDIAAAIERVGDDCGITESAIRACIADLPAEEI